MYRLTLGAVLFLVLAAGLAAQSSLKPEIFAGYSVTPSDFGYFGGPANGWNASLNLSKGQWGFVSDFAGYYKTESCCSSFTSQSYTFMFGPQFSVPVRKVTPFVHGLIGVGHIHATGASMNLMSTPTSLAYAFGGGVDLPIGGRFAWRFEGDYLHTAFQTFDNQLRNTRSNARASTGLVFRF